MPSANFGDVVRPLHCRASVSAEKTQIALTFSGDEHAPVTIVLPLAGAVGLQRKLAQSLYLLGVRPVAQNAPAAGGANDTNSSAAANAN
jgi:hypothetical protein